MKSIDYFLRLSFYACIALLISSCVSNTSYIKKRKNDNKTIYKSLIIEVQPTQFCSISKSSMQGFINCLDRYHIVNKKNVHIIYNKEIIATKETWSLSDLNKISKGYRKYFNSSNKKRHYKIFIMCIPGMYVSEEEDKSSVAGLQWSNCIAIFRQQPDTFNKKLLFHEFCHSLKLVDRSKRTGVPTNPKRTKHCNDEKCIMFWSVSTKDERLCDLCVRDVSQLIVR